MKIFLLSFCLFTISLLKAQVYIAPENIDFVPSDMWLPYLQNGKTGWKKMNGGGHILPCTISRIEFPVVFTSTGKTAIIDAAGKLLTDTVYYSMESIYRWTYFRDYNLSPDSLFFVSSAEGLEGIISSSGRFLIEPQFDNMQLLSPTLVVCSANNYDKDTRENKPEHRLYSLSRMEFLPGISNGIHYNSNKTSMIIATEETKTSKDSGVRSFVIDREGRIKQTFALSPSEIWIWPFENNPDRYANDDSEVQIVMTPRMAYLYVKNELSDSIRITQRSEKLEQLEYKVAYPLKSSFPVSVPVAQNPGSYELLIQMSSGNTIFNKWGDTLLHSPTEKYVSDGRIVSVVNENGRYGITRYQTRPRMIYDSIVEQAVYPHFSSWSDGRNVWFIDGYMHAVKSNETGKYAIADSNLIIRTAFDYDSVIFIDKYRNHEGVVVAVKNKLMSVLDRNFNTIIPAEYDEIEIWGDTLIEVNYTLKKGEETGFANRKGEVVWTGNYDVVKLYSYNPFLIQFGEPGKLGIMKSDGSIVLEQKYRQIDYLGFFTVLTETGYGLNDPNGKQLLPPVYSEIMPLSVKVVLVGDDKSFRFYDTEKGKFVGKYKAPSYASVEVKNDSVFFCNEGLIAICDLKGRIIFKPPHEPIYGLRILNNHTGNDKYLVDKKGTIITKAYDHIWQNSMNYCNVNNGSFLYMQRSDSMSVFDTKTRKILEKPNVDFLFVAEDSDSLKGLILFGSNQEIELYDTKFEKVTPLKFDRYEQDTWLKSANPEYAFNKVPVVHLYSGSLRYTFDRRTFKLSGPIDTNNDLYDVYGKLAVKDYDKIETIENDPLGYSYVFPLTKVTKGNKTYWFTPERYLYHVSEN